MSDGWIGVDLDGTLAEYHGWIDSDHIGEPIPKMLRRVKRWIAQHKEVRIMTARVCPPSSDDAINSHLVINAWCLKHIGCSLPITHEKDYGMIELWDDRAVQVIPNTGERADGKYR